MLNYEFYDDIDEAIGRSKELGATEEQLDELHKRYVTQVGNHYIFFDGLGLLSGLSLPALKTSHP